jgi:hypothetical protein
MVSSPILRLPQQALLSQLARVNVPLLALQPTQHRAMWLRETRGKSLTMCSHEARPLAGPSGPTNG